MDVRTDGEPGVKKTSTRLADGRELIYYDLRVRKEGLSIDELARSVRIDPSTIDRTRFERPDDFA